MWNSPAHVEVFLRLIYYGQKIIRIWWHPFYHCDNAFINFQAKRIHYFHYIPILLLGDTTYLPSHLRDHWHVKSQRNIGPQHCDEVDGCFVLGLCGHILCMPGRSWGFQPSLMDVGSIVLDVQNIFCPTIQTWWINDINRIAIIIWDNNSFNLLSFVSCASCLRCHAWSADQMTTLDCHLGGHKVAHYSQTLEQLTAYDHYFF